MSRKHQSKSGKHQSKSGAKKVKPLAKSAPSEELDRLRNRIVVLEKKLQHVVKAVDERTEIFAQGFESVDLRVAAVFAILADAVAGQPNVKTVSEEMYDGRSPQIDLEYYLKVGAAKLGLPMAEIGKLADSKETADTQPAPPSPDDRSDAEQVAVMFGG